MWVSKIYNFSKIIFFANNKIVGINRINRDKTFDDTLTGKSFKLCLFNLTLILDLGRNFYRHSIMTSNTDPNSF